MVWSKGRSKRASSAGAVHISCDGTAGAAGADEMSGFVAVPEPAWAAGCETVWGVMADDCAGNGGALDLRVGTVQRNKLSRQNSGGGGCLRAAGKFLFTGKH